jgi:hypothetical protein
VILGHDLWQRRFGGAADVVGRSIQVDGVGRTIVGVMPASFRLPMDYRAARPTEMWTPFVIDPANVGEWGSRLLLGVGRLQPGIGPPAATSELQVLWRRWVAAGFVADQVDDRFDRAAIPVGEMVTGSVRTPLIILLATVAVVLMIALANVANLLLAQAAVRSRERAGTPRSMTVVIKTEPDPLRVTGALRTVVREMDPNLPVSEIRTLEDVEARALAEPRLTTWLLGGFALLALAMAAIGIYGTISLLVSDRTEEIGVRLALGAQRSSILKMVLSQGAALAVTGIGLGMVAAFFLTRSLENLVYGVTTLDPLTFAVVPLVLAAVALLASFTPARRASLVDPIHVLKR